MSNPLQGERRAARMLTWLIYRRGPQEQAVPERRSGTGRRGQVIWSAARYRRFGCRFDFPRRSLKK
jgi:hypothetical protein